MRYLDLFEEKIQLQKKEQYEYETSETIQNAESESKKPAFF